MQIEKIFELHPKAKLAIEFTWDALSVVVALLFAYWLRIGIAQWDFSALEWGILGANVVFTLSALTFAGHYSQIIRFMGIGAVYIMILVLLCSTLYLLLAKYTLNVFMPATVPLIYLMVAITLIAAPRLLIQASAQAQRYKMREKCIIFGAAEAGRSLALTLRAGNDIQPIAFVDDKRQYQGKQVLGLPVASRNEIPDLVKKFGVSKMLLAVNNTSSSRRKELIAELEPFAVELLSIPNIQDIVSGKRKIDELREIKIEDLLGRDPVPPIPELLDINIRGKCVMVTGAGGSIGSELCRQIALSRPTKMVLYELSEFNLYQIENELTRKFKDIEIVPVLASIQDTVALREVFSQQKVQTIYHAAAYKHVPMVESNPLAGIRNNIFGTANVALVGVEYDVEKFVLISTDKAVRPTNIMGATKRFAELYVQGIAELHSDTQFAIVRFGNVLGSSGSVVPLFSNQIRNGGPITVTHPDIIRFFMTIPEAAQLVIQAGAMGRNGEVFVLDMGDPVKIVDLASKMAHLMGHSIRDEDNPDGTIELKFSGLRPGEKLYEELLIDDADTQTQHPRIMGADEQKLPFEEIVMLVDRLNYSLLNQQPDEALQILLEAPLGYAPAKH
ncbi:nucleoside-diphosphate sugar epimerase/dehydratase [Aliiglaciecola sp. M165]|uniref:polysaccharide biosynthesis protein n=1 Tax=Aliiglaciecola sp. M165 TaxID=2593649 RepID=UPI00117EF4D6|nr:nucleoside-diphosphate sugar epimerase/dehydratase [Aliiglaciecola sp. M165]TRY32067.1 polysaccharide biosynthesis protein [Aliiglaciecola sp. M165]